MSVWATIGEIPAALYDEVGTLQQSVAGTYTDVSGLTGLACTVEPISGGNLMASFAMHPGATHTAHLMTYQPTAARAMRFKRGSTYYMVLDVEHHDGQFTDLVLQSTAATG